MSISETLNQILSEKSTYRPSGGKRDDITALLEGIEAGSVIAERRKEWEEKKNAGRKNIINSISADTERLYNNKDVEHKRGQLKKYIENNYDNMDSETMEIAKLHMENFNYQHQKNAKFDLFKSQMDDKFEVVRNFIDNEKNFVVGKQYNTEDEADQAKIDEFRKISEEYTAWSENFVNEYADRLQLPNNSHVLQDLSQAQYINEFMLDSFFSDNKIDKVEYDAYKQSFNTNSMEGINNFKQFKKQMLNTSRENLIKSMDSKIEIANKYKGMLTGAASLEDFMGEEYEDMKLFDENGQLNIEPHELQALEQASQKADDELKIDNTTLQDRTGVNYLATRDKTIHDRIYQKTPPPPKLTQDDIDKLKLLKWSDDEIGNLKYDEAKEYIEKKMSPKKQKIQEIKETTNPFDAISKSGEKKKEISQYKKDIKKLEQAKKNSKAAYDRALKRMNIKSIDDLNDKVSIAEEELYGGMINVGEHTQALVNTAKYFINTGEIDFKGQFRHVSQLKDVNKLKENKDILRFIKEYPDVWEEKLKEMKENIKKKRSGFEKRI
tara:strand:+ start:5619 stop:7274 length:1656 start_codon:yes stop_codon:yes gene_type:complete